MRNILVLKSSILAENSNSNQLIDYFLSQLSGNIRIRDLGCNPLPYYDNHAIIGTHNQAETTEQQKALKLSNQLIDEIKQSDLLVFGVPIYNLGIPAQLKTYLDYLNRAGVTFRYTSNGPQGLIKNKKAVIILASGGFYQNTPLDLASKHIEAVLNFIGIQHIEFVYIEGLSMGEELVIHAKQQAQKQLTQIAQNLT